MDHNRNGGTAYENHWLQLERTLARKKFEEESSFSYKDLNGAGGGGR